MEYTWKVTGLKTKNEGSNLNAVVQTYWQKIGTDENGNTGVFDGATPFTSADVPEGEFIPFAELSEAKILEWIQAVVVGHYEEHVNERIQKIINMKANAVVEVSLPWTTPETVSETTEYNVEQASNPDSGV